MRIISTKNLKHGMKLGKTIYSTDGRVLLTKDCTLTSGYIENLISKGIPSVYIEDEISKDIEIVNAVDDDIKIVAINQIKKLFNELSLKSNKSRAYITVYEYTEMRSIVEKIIDNVFENNGALYSLINTLSTDLSTYNHMVNTAIMSIMVGKSLDITNQRLIDIGVGAIMHDIGKSQIPPEILNKPSQLTQEELEIMKSHTTLGYLMVKENASISAFVKTIILMHHESLDGSGYPLGLTSKDLNIYVQICAVCNMFDGMITDKVYHKKIPIYEVFERISADAHIKYEKDIYDALLKNVAIFPHGSGVQLSNGQKGIVVQSNPENPLRPSVRIIFNSDGKLYPGFKIIDLKKELTLFITDSVEIIY